jgi:hypothetical protein
MALQPDGSTIIMSEHYYLCPSFGFGLLYCVASPPVFPSIHIMESTSRPARVIANALDELGLVTMWHSSRDVKFLCAQRFVRLFAYGGSTLILASYLSAMGISDDRIGLFMTLTLIGDVVISFFLTLFADRMGRKAVLSLGSVLMAGSGVVFALTGNYWILLAAAVFGVISPRYASLDRLIGVYRSRTSPQWK